MAQLKTEFSFKLNPFARLSTLINYNNRRLYEGLFDFAFNADAVNKEFPTRSKKTLALIARVLLLPLTSAVYAASRLMLVVLNIKAYQDNPAKAVGMLGITVLFLGLMLKLAYNTAVFSSPISLSLVMMATTMLYALMLHGVKKSVQHINWVVKDDGLTPNKVTERKLITTPKHLHEWLRLSVKSHQSNLPWSVYYQLNLANAGVLAKYLAEKKPAICAPSEKLSSYKLVINSFDRLYAADKRGRLTDEELNDLKKEAKEKFVDIYDNRLSSVKVVNHKLM